MKKSKILRDLGLFLVRWGFGAAAKLAEVFLLGDFKKSPPFHAASEVRIPFFCMTPEKDPFFLHHSKITSQFYATLQFFSKILLKNINLTTRIFSEIQNGHFS